VVDCDALVARLQVYATTGSMLLAITWCVPSSRLMTASISAAGYVSRNLCVAWWVITHVLHHCIWPYA
jgi:hypothetical protein